MRFLKDTGADQTHKQLELEERLENTNAEMETIQSQFTESEVKVRELSDALEDREIQIVKVRNVLAARVAELEAELRTERDGARAEEKERVFQDRIASLKADNEGFKAKIAELYNQVSDLQAHASNMDGREIGLAKQCSQLESENRQLASKLGSLAEEAAQKAQAVAALQKDRERLEKLAEAVAQEREKLAFQLRRAEALEQQLNAEKIQEMEQLKSEFLCSLQQTNALNEELSAENSRLKEEAQSVIIGLQREKEMSEQENSALREQIAEVSNECEQMKEQLFSLQEGGAHQAQGLEEELRVERNNNCNLKKLVENLERQKMQLEAEIEDKDETQKRLLGKMAKVEAKMDAKMDAKVEAQPPRPS